MALVAAILRSEAVGGIDGGRWSSPFENWNFVGFEEVDGGTMVTLDVHVMWQKPGAQRYLKGMALGWSMSLEKLAAYLVSA